jgi:hypothetical protein
VSGPKVVIASGDGWWALYIDGVCREQGHHLDLVEVLRMLGIEAEYRHLSKGEEAASEIVGEYPQTLDGWATYVADAMRDVAEAEGDD